VIAVGNPFGRGGTVTACIISARGRHIDIGSYDDFIQIDAPINKSNSGGPSFNLDGKVFAGAGAWTTDVVSAILLAAPAGVFRPARLDHTQLGRHHVKALGNVLPDDVQRAAAALTSLVLWFDPRTRAGLTSDAGWRGTIIFQVRERIGEGALATAVGLAGGFAGSTLGPVAALASQRVSELTFPAFEKLAAHRDWLTRQDRERG
jgi:hypothetical protein